ncbi:MAG TPA: hypothetical protein VK116_10410 [Planctomycetota bacterium]|nr:hypothetical protein [Planctomycetota bacterium]
MLDSKYPIASSLHRCARCEREIAPGEEQYSTVYFEVAAESFGRRDFCVPCWREEAARSIERNGGAENREHEGTVETIAFWRTVRPPPQRDGRRRMRFDADVALEIFRKLDPASEESDTAEPVAAQTDVAEPASSEPSDLEASSETELAAREEPIVSASPSASPSRALYPRQKRDLRFLLALLLLRKKRLVLETTQVESGREWLVFREREGVSYRVENPELSDEELDRVRDGLSDLLEIEL